MRFKNISSGGLFPGNGQGKIFPGGEFEMDSLPYAWSKKASPLERKKRKYTKRFKPDEGNNQPVRAEHDDAA